ncbi:MAG: nucleotidyltransferase domain-containing protein [Methanoregula sp.]|jgi:predicted nucleotidyltransferase|nr:nucleotidyltransferase domain-containing protein [Methanoregula sp.]
MAPLSFKSKVSVTILNYFFLNPHAKHYINELARALDLDPKNADRKLKELERAGILRSEFLGKQRYFSLRPNSALVKHWREVFLRTAGFPEQLRLALQGVPGLKEAYIFGSYASQTMDAGSDIDVLAVGGQTALAAQQALRPLQKTSGREINVVTITAAELRQKKQARNPFIKRIFSQPIIKVL